MKQDRFPIKCPSFYSSLHAYVFVMCEHKKFEVPKRKPLTIMNDFAILVVKSDHLSSDFFMSWLFSLEVIKKINI